MDQRLSSDNLYHFTNHYETVAKIINNGFRFSLCDESITSKSLTKNLFNISFCDIKFNESENHRKCYGSNAIVLTKEWGMRNGVSPVRYVHSNSPGLSETYVSLRKNYHLLRGLSMNRTYPKDFEFSLLYLFTSVMELDNKTKTTDIKNEMTNNLESFRNEYNRLDREFANFYNTLKSRNEDEAILFSKYIDSLIYRITELHNELIERDNFTRLYEDEFKCPLQKKEVKKVLYDEREWRAIYIDEIDEIENSEQIGLVDSYMKQGFLPPRYNLKFTEDDVVAILTSDTNTKKSILKMTHSENCLLSNQFIEEKLYTVKEFNEI